MKFFLLLLTIIQISLTVSSQVIFSVQSPSPIQGLYPFTSNGDGSSWGLADLNNPADAIQSTLMLVEDGTPGTNLQGHPISQEGCNTLTNNLTGKIAVIYRNTCGFGLKALNAQYAGAIGVIIINREAGVISMAGGTEGLSVTIPVILISNTDGALLVNEMSNGPVNVFIGNKLGVYANDLGSLPKDIMVAKSFSNPTIVSNTSSEYSFDLGILVRNYGLNDQVNVSVTANVDYNGSSVYSETTTPFNVISGDSSYLYFSPFSLATYSPGKYTLSYQINSNTTDDDNYDNYLESDFIINDTLYSLAPLENLTYLPINTSGSQPSGFSSSYSSCIVFQNANADSLKAEGLYFSASTNITDSLSGLTISVNVSEILDQFVDLNDAPFTGAINTNLLSMGYYTYPIGNQANLQKTVVYKEFDNVVFLENNKRYLFCAQSFSNKIFIGYNTKLNYEMNISNYAQPLVPVDTDGSINLLGFGGDNIPAIAVKMRNDLNLIPPTTYGSQNFTECTGFSITVGTHTYNTSGTFTDVLQNVYGGDSIVTTSLTIIPVNINTTLFNSTSVLALESGATYQWLNCSDNLPIIGATNQLYTATENGNYSVVITKNSCSDTSNCVNIISVGLEELATNELIHVYPNPNPGTFEIQSNEEGDFSLINELGQVVNQVSLNKLNGYSYSVKCLNNGVYYIINDKNSTRQKVVVIN